MLLLRDTEKQPGLTAKSSHSGQLTLEPACHHSHFFRDLHTRKIMASKSICSFHLLHQSFCLSFFFFFFLPPLKPGNWYTDLCRVKSVCWTYLYIHFSLPCLANFPARLKSSQFLLNSQMFGLFWPCWGTETDTTAVSSKPFISEVLLLLWTALSDILLPWLILLLFLL